MTLIGIDLGTTFSAVSIVRHGKPQMIPIAGQNIMPSVVGLSPDNRWLVGSPALNQWTLAPEKTLRSVKRKMGTNEMLTMGEKNYSPQAISAFILKALKQAAEKALAEEVNQAVITVPAYFSDLQRRATYEAGELAGLEVLRIINEPTAAALAYGLAENREELALVYDLGGGTFDVSLVEISAGVVDVRASHGNTHLGGDDFDERLAQWLLLRFEESHQIDLRADPLAQARIRRAAEKAKIQLSQEPFAWVREEYLAEKNGQSLHLEIEVSRAQFLTLIADLLEETLVSVDQVLRDAGIEKPDQVILVGGSTYIPAVRERLAEHLGLSPRHEVNPSEAVALGAGIQAAIIAGEAIDLILVDICPFSLGIAVADILPIGIPIPDRYKVLIPRNSSLPSSQKELFFTLHPDQDTVEIKVYQGEKPSASDNTLLGEFLFENLLPERAGELAQVTVGFDLDLNGILKVEALDRGSKQSQGLTVKTLSQRLSQQDIHSEPLEFPENFFTETRLPEETLHEMEVLLARAHQLNTTALLEEITAVEVAYAENDIQALQEALENLSDALFEWDV